MIISIVGRSGSGKSTISKTLESYDERIFHIDVDKISHYVLTLPEVKEKLSTTFSSNVVMDNEVQRKVLGKIVFASPEAMKQLTDITWASMESVIDKLIEENKEKIILLDWNLLPNTKYFEQSDLRIWVEAPFEDRLDRVIKRAIKEGGITKEYFAKRDDSGSIYEEGKYDIVIKNINKEKTNEEVRKVYEKSILRRKF